jgi:PAS domain S-box-containing protein
MKFDNAGRGLDYRFVEVNPAFQRQTGLADATGRWVRDLVPAHEQHWFDIYGRVALTGEPARFENRAEALGRWFDVHAFRVGGPEERRVAVLFNDISERRAAEDVVRITEERYRLAARATNDAIWDWDLAANRVLWNEALETAYGHPLAEVEPIGNWWIDHIHPDDRARIDRNIHAVIDGAEAGWSDEYRFRRADGSYADVFDRGYVIRDAGGRAVRMIGAMLDLSERKRAEEALRLRGEEFYALADNIPSLCWIAYADGHIFWYNRRWYEYTGTSPEGQEGWGWESVHDPEMLPAVVARWKLSLATGEPFEMVFPLKGADGVFRPFLTRIVPIRDAAGRIVRWFGTNVDITEQREIEARLEQRVAERTAERNLLATIVETTDAFIQVADRDYRWLAINKAAADEFERIFGVRPRVGGSMLDLLADRPEHQAAVRAVWGRALAGEEFTIVDEFGDPSRARRCYEIKFNILRGEGGERLGAYQIVYDVTERLLREQALAEAEALRQAQKMEAVGQLTGGLAHDFNNLLAGIVGSLDLMQTRLSQGRTDALERYAKAAMSSAQRAAALTHRLLAFSRRQPLDPKPVNVNGLITGMEDLLRRTIGPLHALEMVTAGGLWTTLCDPNQLESAILNLAINARDAMPDGGKLTIETCNAHLDDFYVAAQRAPSPTASSTRVWR